MSNTITKFIVIFALAGILMTPACSPIDKDKDLKQNEIITSPDSEIQQGEDDVVPNDDENQSGTSIAKPEETEESIQVITTDEELDEYFNSISDEEIEELFKIIEGIDISDDINPDADPGFDEIVIP